MRLIDAEKLKLTLRNSEHMDDFIDENGNTLYSDHLLIGADYYDVCKAIDEQPTVEAEQKWIPCSERLPDVAQRVLLSGHGKVMVGMLHSFGKYSLEPTGIMYVYQKDDIDAWMPLPESYKSETEEQE